MDTFQERVDQVYRRIEAACARSGRRPDEVRLVAVSKTHGPDAVREAAACGLTVFGENKVQEAFAKIPSCPGNISWHLVGHLQRNKVRLAVQLFDVIHSVDSLRLLEAVDRVCDEEGKNMPVMIEVNVAGESSKYGTAPEGVPQILESANRLMHVNIVGLMTMPPYYDEPEKVRPHFRRLRELRDGWRASTGLGLNELSMGMTHDFEIAIEEGAAWVRVGTALFGERSAKNEQQPVEEG